MLGSSFQGVLDVNVYKSAKEAYHKHLRNEDSTSMAH